VFTCGHCDPMLPIVLIDAQAYRFVEILCDVNPRIAQVACRGGSAKIRVSEIIADLKWAR
ncbi:MAG: hypothetical protein ACRECN_01780, partial [Methylocella sp.]